MAVIEQDHQQETATLSPTSVGATLRTAREKTGKSQADIADALRIRAAYIASIEAGRYAELPGGAYASGFVRAYADYLSLDAAEIVRRFKAETDGSFAPRAELVFPSPMSEGRIPGGAVLLAGLVLAGIAYGAWYSLSKSDEQVAESVPPLPDRLAAMIQQNQQNPPSTTATTGDAPAASQPAEAPKAADGSPAPASNGQDVVPPDEGEGQQQAAAPNTTPVSAAPQDAAAPAASTVPAAPVAAPAPTAAAPAAQTAAPAAPVPAAPAPAIAPAPVVAAPVVAPAPAPVTPAAAVATPAQEPAAVAAAAEPPQEPRTFGESGGRVQLRAVGDSWIGVYEADGTRIASRTLRKGDVYQVPGREGMTLTVGSAGALVVVVDGQEVGPLGKSGIVRKNVPLDPDKLRSQQ